MAAALFRQKAATAGLAITVASVGLGALAGMPASSGAITAMQRYGVDLSAHIAGGLDDTARQYDLILTMTRRHRDMVQRLFPVVAERVHTLKEYVGASGPVDVADPFGGGVEVYEASAGELADLVGRLVDKLQREWEE